MGAKKNTGCVIWVFSDKKRSLWIRGPWKASGKWHALERQKVVKATKLSFIVGLQLIYIFHFISDMDKINWELCATKTGSRNSFANKMRHSFLNSRLDSQRRSINYLQFKIPLNSNIDFYFFSLFFYHSNQQIFCSCVETKLNQPPHLLRN